MKPEDNVRTITILEADTPFPQTLKTGLGYAGATHWVQNGKLYIFNCALADAQILCRNAGKEGFLWGQAGAALGRYHITRDRAEFVALATDEVLPPDYMDHALPILHTQDLLAALDENRTFLSRGAHRRAASRETGFFVENR